jgi:hypothetical protein
MFIENRISELERDISEVLAQLAYHIRPKVVELIQNRNLRELSYFRDLFEYRINVDHYLFDGSTCVFPEVKRYVSGRGVEKSV